MTIKYRIELPEQRRNEQRSSDIKIMYLKLYTLPKLIIFVCSG